MEDFPIVNCPKDVAAWTENFCLAGYDPASGIDVFLHLGRWRKDLFLWRELVAIILPDGTAIAHRAIGNARASECSPGGPNLRHDIVQPGRQFRWHFLGGARRLPSEMLRDNVLSDGPLDRVEFTFDFNSDLPLWDIGQSGHASDMAGHGHVEQIGRAQAEIRVGQETFTFDSLVNRDHSRGPRVMGRLCGHLWMHGILDNGLRFQAYEAQEGSSDNTVFSEASVIVDGILKQAKLEIGFHLPQTSAIGLIKERVPFALSWEGGSIAGRVRQFPTTIFCQFTAPWDSYIGTRQIDEQGNSRYIEQSVLFELDDGSVGYGHMERTVPGKLIADPI